MPSGVCSIKLQYDQVLIHESWDNFLFSLRVVLTSFMRLVTSMLGYFFILSAYLWLSLLISSLAYGTLRSWCRVSLKTYQGALTMICFEFFVVFLYLSWRLCLAVGRHKSRFKDCFVQQQFIFDRQSRFAAEQPVHSAQLNSKLFSLGEYVLSPV